MYRKRVTKFDPINDFSILEKLDYQDEYIIFVGNKDDITIERYKSLRQAKFQQYIAELIRWGETAPNKDVIKYLDRFPDE